MNRWPTGGTTWTNNKEFYKSRQENPNIDPFIQ